MVIYAPFLLPSTCLLPSQKERIVAKRREKQKMWAENMASVFQEVHSRALVEPEASVNTLLTGPSAALSYTGYVFPSCLAQGITSPHVVSVFCFHNG